MSVLHIALVAPGIPESATGPSVSIRELARQLTEGGHEVTVITADLAKAGIARSKMVEIDQRVGLKVFELNTSFGRRLYYSKEMKHWLDANIARFDVVDIQGVWSFVAVHAAAACIRAGIPYVLTLHGQMSRWDWNKRYWRKRLFFSARLRQVWHSAAAFRFLSKGEAENSMADPGDRAVVIPHWINPVSNDFKCAPARLRCDLAIPKAAPLLVFLGRISAQKGVIEILDAFELLWHRRQSSTLLLVGPLDGDYGTQVMRKIGHLSSRGNIRVLGPVYDERKFELLSAGSLFITLSKNEGLPIAVLEAMGAGLPVVITEQANLPEVVQYGAGTIVPHDPKVVADVLDCLLTDADRRRRMSEQAQKLIRERFTPQAVLPQIVGMYNELASTRTRRMAL